MEKNIINIAPGPDFVVNGSNIDLDGENVSIIATDPTKKAHLTIKCTKCNNEKIIKS